MADYIIEQPSTLREREALRNLLRAPGLANQLFGRLGLTPLSWLVIELPTRELAGIYGEIDVVGGKISVQRVNETGHLEA